MSIKVIAIVVIVLVAGGVGYVLRDVLKLVWDETWNLLKTFYQFVRSLVIQILQLLGLLWILLKAIWTFLVLLRCYFYLARWKLRAVSRRAFLDTSFFVVGSALLWFLLEAAHALIERLDEAPQEGSHDLSVPVFLETWPSLRAAVVTLASYVDTLMDLGRAGLHRIVAAPLYVDVIILLLSAMLLIHHASEWFLRRREMEVPAAVAKLLEKFRATDESKAQAKKEFHEHVLDEIQHVLMKGSRRKIALSVMDLDAATNELAVRLIRPVDSADTTLRLKVDPSGDLTKAEGAAGVARMLPSVVYVPSISHRFGFDMATFHPVKVPYKPPKQREPWRCVFCVPFEFAGGQKAILNISSNKKNTFEPLDFEVARMASAFCSLIN